MTIGFFSPLPPARSGVADYAATLLRAMQERAHVEVGNTGADICLYHLGNNELHRDIYRLALAKPGVIVIHDAVLQHFFLGMLDEREYVEEFCYNYGPWTESLAARLWRGRRRSAADPQYFSYPMLKRITEGSLGVVVHNPGAAALVREHGPDARVFEIPHLYADAASRPAPGQMESARRSMSFAPDAFVFGVFGHLRESKRVLPVLRAFARVRRETPAALLLAGDFASSDLERSVRPWLSQPGIVHRGYTPETEFLAQAAAVDCCVSLRFPAAGETSGITIRLMGLGKPLIVTRGPETERFPEAACVRVDTGPAEEEMLAASMLALARNKEAAAAMGKRAAAYIAEQHSVSKAAGLYLEALTTCYHYLHR